MNKQLEIARQFDLPERQSKLNTMLREEGLKDEQVYCICRSADVTRFMIGCDNCEEWYHGDCIDVTEHEANKIRKFYCKACRNKFPSLQIKYKEKRNHHHHHKHRHEKTKHTPEVVKKDKKDKISNKCGECEACYIKNDCGRCEHCKDMVKFGGTGKLNQKCKKRQCRNFYQIGKKLLQNDRDNKHNSSNRFDHSYNSKSSQQSTNTSSSNATKESPNTSSLIITTLSERYNEELSRSQTKEELLKSQQFSSSYEKVDSSKGSSKIPTDPLNNVTNSSAKRRPEVISEDEYEPPARVKKIKPKDETHRKKKISTANRKRKPRDPESDSDDAVVMLDMEGPRQCCGPQCIKAARPTSKYCSEECGLKLAEARIYSVLPQRIQEWKMTPCISEDKDREQLQQIRAKQLEARKALQALDDKHKEFDILLAKWKSVPIDPQADEEGDEEGSEGAIVYCVTCGHEVPLRRAIKHMHSCYNKLESQMSFGSMFKTRMEGNNMFCDAFNPANRTYCKRLRVMCPEHTKQSKTSNTEVCGCPLTNDVFTETGNVCRMSKKKCVRHYCWEKLRRATIDMERVRQCLKLDELVEQERQVRLAMTNRAGVLGLMLHSTYDHEYAAKMQMQHQNLQAHQSDQSLAHHNDHQYHHNEQYFSTDNQTPSSNTLNKSSSTYQGQNRAQNISDHHYHRQKQPTPSGNKETTSKPAVLQQSSKRYFKIGNPSTSVCTYSNKVNQHPSKKSSNESSKITFTLLSSNKTLNTYKFPNNERSTSSNNDKPVSHDHQYFSSDSGSVKIKHSDHMYSSKY